MHSPFIYDKYVTGKDFLGRQSNAKVLGNLISQGESVAIYEPPKTGKTSLIQQALFESSLKGKRMLAGQLSLLNVRSIESFLLRFGATAIRTVASTPQEYSELISKHLPGTHFIFDQRNYSDNDMLVSTNWTLDDNDMEMMLRLPQRLSIEKGQPLLMILDEFQNIMMTEDGDKLCKALESLVTELSGEPAPKYSLIFCGSMVNAMKYIFEEKRYFYRRVTHLSLSPVDEREIIEHIVKGFLLGGKIIERELLLGTCKLFKNNLWYINHFIAICDALSKGYIVESTLLEALNSLLSIHEPRFRSTMNNLTTFQISLLRAILDGVNKFSASEIIQKYSLNSSANVKRLKDALMKKEIIVFNEKEEASLQDPLFEYWVRKYYFEMD